MRRKRLDTLTGMRALAAAVVFLDHIPGLLSGRLRDGEAYLGTQGAIGVTFFFALSGFVLTWSAREHDRPRDFYRRRFARIVPAYVVACAAGVVLTVGFLGGAVRWGPIFTSFTLLQSWVPSKNYYFSYNGVGWSLSDEAFFYLLFPVTIPFLRKLRCGGRRVLQAGLLVAIGSLAAAAPHLPQGTYLVNHFPPARFLEFVLGATLAIDGLRGEWLVSRLRLVPALLLAAAAYLLAALPVGDFRNVALPLVPVLLLLGAGAQADIAGLGGVLGRRVFVWLGEISYCFYLVHQLVLKVLARLLGYLPTLPGDGIVWVAVALGLSVVAAWSLHEIVEKPFERRLSGGRTDPPGPSRSAVGAAETVQTSKRVQGAETVQEAGAAAGTRADSRR